MTTFTRKIQFRPAFDKRDPDPKKNYGVHGLEIQFQLIGPDGGTTYTIYTNWMLPHVQAETDTRPLDSRFPYLFHKPISAGLSVHWRKPQYERQYAVKGCAITGGDCYCDSTSITDEVFNALVTDGEEAVWKILEDRYNDWKPE